MRFLLEFKYFYKEGDIVLIEYWYNDMITPVKITEFISKRKLKISHNNENSKIKNAPDEIINVSDILGMYRN